VTELFASDKSGAIIFHELPVDAGVVGAEKRLRSNG
jgi:hypothetical protein